MTCVILKNADNYCRLKVGDGKLTTKTPVYSFDSQYAFNLGTTNNAIYTNFLLAF